MDFIVNDYIKNKCFKVKRKAFIKFIMDIKDDDTFCSYSRKREDGSVVIIWGTFAYDLLAISDNEQEMNILKKDIKDEYIKRTNKENKHYVISMTISIMMIIVFITIMSIGVCITLGAIK